MPYPGLIYWGVFIACGAIVVLYVLWMALLERRASKQESATTKQPPTMPR